MERDTRDSHPFADCETACSGGAARTWARDAATAPSLRTKNCLPLVLEMRGAHPGGSAAGGRAIACGRLGTATGRAVGGSGTRRGLT